MKTIALKNPFDAPVYYEESVSSTMEAARSLADSGAPSGSVIMAGFQERGRGRAGRSWEAERGSALLFTLLLRCPDTEALPQALTLRTGLALALAIEEYAPALRAEIKWPNDIMLGGKKAAGILAESDGKTVYIGAGVNIFQSEFSPGLRNRATRIALALGITPGKDPEGHGFALLEKILAALHRELETARPWKDRLEARLYMKGKTVRFAPGGPDSDTVIEGVLQGVGSGGELLMAYSGGVKSFASGELRLYERR
jgi:BirA family biotin operon repressor/biotin-[acetyl-CoA-carboxylase] ligase